MSEKQRMDDTAFADAILKNLPAGAVPAALEARIMADFDRLAARRRPSPLQALVARWSETLWPGAPVWQPASVLALSLIIGLAAGSFVPTVSTVSPVSDQLISALDTSVAYADEDKDQ